jgi:tetratricopeptide (TPR) repeat protein
MRAAVLALLFLPGCGFGPSSFPRPDYSAEARARCDEAEAESDPSRALALYGLALEAEPAMPRAHLGRAGLLEKQGRLPEAERSFSLAVDFAPDDEKAPVLIERARFHQRRARHEAAIRDLNRALSLLATWPEPARTVEGRLLRAESRLALRNWSDAASDIEAALLAGPDADQRRRAVDLMERARKMRQEERR